MTTNEERYEVAARLRESCEFISDKPKVSLEQNAFDTFERILACVGYEQGNIFDYLADLIEPEPEHNCKNIAASADDFCCSKCNAFVKGTMVDDFDYWYPIGKVLSHCPNCGEKVVN